MFVPQEYQKPLLEPANALLPPRKVRRIFYRVQELQQCHALFQVALASRVAHWDTSQRIGDLFVASVSRPAGPLPHLLRSVRFFGSAQGVPS